MKLSKLLLSVALLGGVIGSSACSSNTLVVYTEAGFAPFEYVDGGKIVGVDVDIMNQVGDKLGKKVYFENVSFDTIVDTVSEGKLTNVGAAGLSITDERLEKVDFSIPYYVANLYVIYNVDAVSESFSKVMNDGVTGVYWSSLETTKGIGIQTGTTADFFLSDEVSEGGSLEGTKKTGYSLLDTAVADIGLNIDYVVSDELPAKKLVEGKDKLACLPLYYEVSDEPAYDEYAIAVTKGQTELLDTINEVLESLLVADEDGVTTIQKMVNTHLGIK